MIVFLCAMGSHGIESSRERDIRFMYENFPSGSGVEH